MEIKVLGGGCANCRKLAENAERALSESGIDGNVSKVTDYAEIMGYGVMATPGLVIDEKVVVSGRVPSADEISELIGKASA